MTEHVRAQLARHKAPRHVMVVQSVGRGPNGKADYVALRRRVADWLLQRGMAALAVAQSNQGE